jgi:glycosyltransferase involved in cell wall biosynthesis
MIINKPLISVVIIFLNPGDAFFNEAIASVFSQTYSNWELLFVDDGSTDISTAIAQQYVQQYPDRVHYLEHEGHQNRGMSASRNLGIQHAKGEYITLLDADDIWLPEKLARQVDILETHLEAGMVYGSTLMWHSWTGNPEDQHRDRQRVLGVQPDTLVQPPTLLALVLQNAETPGTCGILIRRKVVEEVGGFVESFRGMYEDQAFFSKVLLKIPVFVESGCWDRYRQHPQSSCHIAETQGQYDPRRPSSAERYFLSWLETYLLEQNVTHTELRQALNSALFPYRHPNLYRWSKQNQYLKRQVKGRAKSFARQIIPNKSWLTNLH